MLVKKLINGNLMSIDVEVKDVNAENFIVPKGSEQSYFCKIEIKKFDSNSGKRLSIPRIQSFGKKEFEQYALNELRKLGYSIDILHSPKVWQEQQAKLKEMKMKELNEQREKLNKEKEEAYKKAAEEESAKMNERIDLAIEEALKKQAKSYEKEIKALKASIKKK